MPMTTPQGRVDRGKGRRADTGRARSGRFVSVIALGLAVATLTPSAPAAASLLDEPPKLYTFKLDDPSAPRLGLLRSFHNAEIERPGPLRRYLWGKFGQWRNDPWWQLAWRPSHADVEGELLADQSHGGEIEAMRVALLADEQMVADVRLFGFAQRRSGGELRIEPNVVPAWSGLDPSRVQAFFASTGRSFVSNGFDSLWAPPQKPVPDWRCRRRPAVFVRYSGERDVFPLVRCDGSVEPDALDRLSIMARPPEAPRTGALLPDEPDPEAALRGEWIPDVRLVHPRLLWLLQKVADAFPWRSIYIYSGYRPSAIVAGTSHQSMHAVARAMDIQVHGVPNATLLQFCRKLEDVGCGFYPNSKFVHVDVRRPGTGHALWIDASGPGEPPRYVDSWPGVIESGGMAWGSSRLPSGSSTPAPPRYGGPP